MLGAGQGSRDVPHLVVEYSANLADRVDIDRSLGDLHRAALATGIFELGAVRTRGAVRDRYVIADGAADNAFVHVTVRIGMGRDEATKNQLADALFAAVCGNLEETHHTTPLAISFEVQEIEPTLSRRWNNLHDRVIDRSTETTGG
jgi:5-carboxymethyl-2-hydroxymuconate isomerase